MDRQEKSRTMLMVSLVVLLVLLSFGLLFLISRGRDTVLPVGDRAGAEENTVFRAELAGEGKEGAGPEYVFTCPDTVWTGEALIVLFYHQYAAIRVNGRMVYERLAPSGDPLGKSPGNYYAVVPLRPEDAHAEVRIRCTPAYPGLRVSTPEIRLEEPGSVLTTLMQEEGINILVGMLCIAGGLIFVLVSVLGGFEGADRPALLFLGIFVALFGLSRVTDQKAVILWVSFFLQNGNPRMLSALSIACYMLSPLFLTGFFMNSYSWIGIYPRLFWAELLLAWIFAGLQLSGLRDLRQNLPLMSANYTLCIFLILFRALSAIVLNRDGARRKWNYYFYILMIAGGIADTVVYYTHDRSQVTDITLVIVFLYVMVRGIATIREAMRRRDRLRELEVELQDQRVAVMMSQIRPHFIYNTLNTIYGLCDIDTEKAKEAIHDFSRYLRGNFESLGKRELVPFLEELENVRCYLAIEKLRFGEKLNVVYDVQYEAFLLPALTIQPLVENAVRHGIRGRGGEGTVAVCTRETDRWVEVTVEDDGVGFETDGAAAERQDSLHAHIGLENVRQRLEEMCGGELLVKSSSGSGTRVLIRLPLRRESHTAQS